MPGSESRSDHAKRGRTRAPGNNGNGTRTMTLDSLIDVLLSWRFILLAVFVSMALYAHLRGRTHQRFLREVFGPATLLAPINVPIYLSSAVPSTPFWDIDLVPGLRFLDRKSVV